jgi:hypothetical protein
VPSCQVTTSIRGPAKTCGRQPQVLWSHPKPCHTMHMLGQTCSLCVSLGFLSTETVGNHSTSSVT